MRYYRKKGFVVGAQDEASFGLIPLVTRGWAIKGSKPIAIINHANKYTNVFGARSQKSFVFTFSKRKRQVDFVRFLHKLQKRWGHVLLFVDGARAHRGKQVEAFLRRHPKTFKLEYFLAYTPELNPIEQCWKPARQKLANRLIKTLPTAKYHLRKTLNNKKNLPKMYEYL